MDKYRYLGPIWLQSAKNQIDLVRERSSAPAQKIKIFVLNQCKVCIGRKFYEN